MKRALQAVLLPASRRAAAYDAQLPAGCLDVCVRAVAIPVRPT